MRKMSKKILAFLLAAVMVFGAAPLSGFVGLVLPNIFDFKAEATQSKSANFSSNYTLNGEPEDDMLAIALAQKDKTKSDLGYTEAWCANFVCDCAKLANQEKAIPFYGGCNGLRKQVIAAGGKEVSSRKKGDLIFYYCNNCSLYVHVGLVLDSTYTIEGNYSGKVTMVSGSYSHYDDYGNKHSTSSGTIVKTYVRPAYSSTGEHIHNYVAEGYEQLHPHKVYRKCSCGDWYYTGDTKKLSTCLTCYPPVLKVYFNANGGSTSSDSYKISSNLICNKSDSTKFYQSWTYNKTKENGLTNGVKTFGLYKTGYSFAGWGTKANGGTVFDDNNASIKPSDLNSNIKNGSCSIALYAQWKPNTLKVYYNSNGASISSDTYKISSNVVCNKSDGSKFIQNWSYNNKKENGLTNHSTFGLYKSGYTFAGWGTKSSGGTIYSQGDNTLLPTTLNSKIKDGDCSLTLYAQWVPNTLKVYYNVNGASITSDTYKVNSNLIYTKSDSAKFYQKWTYNNTKENGLYNASSFGISKTGYHFAGWGTKASGGTVFDQNDASVTPLKISSNIKDGSQSITLYAQWEPNTVRVYYNANGGQLNSDTYKLVSDNVCYLNNGEKIYHDWTYNNPVKNGFTNASTMGLYRSGYTFAGWSTKASGGTVFDQNDTSIVPTDFTSTINSKNCSVTMYAQWIPNKVTLHFQSAGELLCKTHAENLSDSRFFTTEAIERTSETQLKYGSKTYEITGNQTSTLTYGVTTNAVSISEAGLSINEHLGCGYIAYRDRDDSWRVRINDTLDWCTADEINKAIADGIFDGYAIYSQTASLTYTSTKGNIYFYAVWASDHTHSYTLTDSYEGSCTEESYSTYTCSCGDSYQIGSPATGHVWVMGSYLPTCEEKGCSTRTCTKCGEGETEYTEPLGHSYIGTVVREPSCLADGEIEYKCTRCDSKYFESVSADSHNYVYDIIEPTCTDNGYTLAYCSVCGESTISNLVDPKPHNVQSEIVSPTCTEEGYTLQRCLTCEYSERVDVIKEKGHTYNDSWEILEFASYRETGVKRRSCISCGHSEYEIIPILAFSGTCPECSETFTDIEKYDIHMKYESNKSFYKIQIAPPSVNTINYGDSIILHAALEKDFPFELIPTGWYIEWTVNNDNFARTQSNDGKTFKISPNKSGNTVVTVTLYDASGNVISSDEQVMTSKAGFFDKLIAFFKKLFGFTETIPQAFKRIF